MTSNVKNKLIKIAQRLTESRNGYSQFTISVFFDDVLNSSFVYFDDVVNFYAIAIIQQ